jgi:hypothetical protein
MNSGHDMTNSRPNARHMKNHTECVKVNQWIEWDIAEKL